jgi:hypothetical protein
VISPAPVILETSYLAPSRWPALVMIIFSSSIEVPPGVRVQYGDALSVKLGTLAMDAILVVCGNKTTAVKERTKEIQGKFQALKF